VLTIGGQTFVLWKGVGLKHATWVGTGYGFCFDVFHWSMVHVNVFALGWLVWVVGANIHPLQRAMPIRAKVQFPWVYHDSLALPTIIM